MTLKEHLEKIKSRGLVCLVPKKEAINKNSMLLTSHEKTLCDCEVLQLIQIIEVLAEANEFIEHECLHSETHCPPRDDMKLKARQAQAKIKEILEGG